MCPANQALGWFTCYVLCTHAGQHGTLHCHRQNTLWKSLHFFFLCLFLSFCPPILLLSFLPLIIFLSWFPYLWLYFTYISIPLLPSSGFLCSVYLPTNIAVKWLSFQLHVLSSNLDCSLSWVKEFSGNFPASPWQMLWYWPQHALIINRLTITCSKKRYLVMKCDTNKLIIMR